MTRSIRGILSLVLALTSGSVLADWTPVGAANSIFAAYADKESIRRHGGMVRMSGMYDFRKGDFTPEGLSFFSTTVLREYDCDARRVRLLSYIDFSGPMGGGRAVGVSDSVRRWEAIVEGALDENYLKIACGQD